MLTTEDIFKKASKKFNLPVDTIRANYKAWVKGLKDRLVEKPILYFHLKNGIVLYYTLKVDKAEYGVGTMSDGVKKMRRQNKAKVKEIEKDFKEVNERKRAVERLLAFNHTPPLDYYAYRQNITLKEAEEAQTRMFNMINRHNYDLYYSKKKRDLRT